MRQPALSAQLKAEAPRNEDRRRGGQTAADMRVHLKHTHTTRRPLTSPLLLLLLLLVLLLPLHNCVNAIRYKPVGLLRAEKEAVPA